MKRPKGKQIEVLGVVALAGRGEAGWVKRRLGEAWGFLPENRLREVSVVLVGDSRMSRLHERSHGDATPTDVLTYELEREGRFVSEGEVVVCVSEARRRVGGDRMALRREVLLYALHGVLHLCGMDDRKAKDYQAMHRKEDEILEKIGVGAVFAPGLGEVRGVGKRAGGR